LLQLVIETSDAVGFLIAQYGVADARELVGERADSLVVIAALLDLQCPTP
jgi:hypothetical protein